MENLTDVDAARVPAISPTKGEYDAGFERSDEAKAVTNPPVASAC
jgi:hypothetical protein